MKKNWDVLVGQVLGFRYLNGTTHRTREYSRSFAFIDTPNSSELNMQTNPIGFLCAYFRYGIDGTLTDECQGSSYINLNSYMATVLAPTFENHSLRLSAILLDRIVSFKGMLYTW